MLASKEFNARQEALAFINPLDNRLVTQSHCCLNSSNPQHATMPQRSVVFFVNSKTYFTSRQEDLFEHPFRSNRRCDNQNNESSNSSYTLKQQKALYLLKT